jgi:hypothetical protein
VARLSSLVCNTSRCLMRSKSIGRKRFPCDIGDIVRPRTLEAKRAARHWGPPTQRGRNPFRNQKSQNMQTGGTGSFHRCTLGAEPIFAQEKSMTDKRKVSGVPAVLTYDEFAASRRL